jgi:hypothetical protein
VPPKETTAPEPTFPSAPTQEHTPVLDTRVNLAAHIDPKSSASPEFIKTAILPLTAHTAPER